MRILKLEQGSQEWLDARRKCVCASDIPIIMGLSPYMDRAKLLAIKRGEEEQPPMNANMAYGKIRENDLRDTAGIIFNESFKSRVILHDQHDYLMASLDGVNLAEDKILEIKACSRDVFDLCINGIVTPKYMPQIQFQLYCSGLERAIFFCGWKSVTHFIWVNRDEDMISDILLEADKFYEEMTA